MRKAVLIALGLVNVILIGLLVQTRAERREAIEICYYFIQRTTELHETASKHYKDDIETDRAHYKLILLTAEYGYYHGANGNSFPGMTNAIASQYHYMLHEPLSSLTNNITTP